MYCAEAVAEASANTGAVLCHAVLCPDDDHDGPVGGLPELQTPQVPQAGWINTHC